MDPIHSYPYHWISVVCSAATIQEELAEHSGQSTSSITGSRRTVDTLHYTDTRTVDSVCSVHYSTTTDVLCCICSVLTSFMVGNTSEMSTKHLPVPSTKVARS